MTNPDNSSFKFDTQIATESQSNKEKLAGLVKSLKEVVEYILKTSFAEDNSSLTEFKGILSTKLENSTLTSKDFYGKCGMLSDELEELLWKYGVSTRKTTSGDFDTSGHTYLSLSLIPQIVIEPSIGQFIEGHNYVFVGTREQLEDLVLHQTGEGKQFSIINTRSKNNPEEALRRIWGDKNIIYSITSEERERF